MVTESDLNAVRGYLDEADGLVGDISVTPLLFHGGAAEVSIATLRRMFEVVEAQAQLLQALTPLKKWAELALARLDAENEGPASDSLPVLRVENGQGKAVVSVGDLRAVVKALESIRGAAP